MTKKKHIDQIFKERFEKLEATPPPHVWENIQAQLEEKKKGRKVLPLWWKLGGVAALLALMFTIGNSVYDSTNNTPIVDGDSENTRSILNKKNHSPLIDTDTQIFEDKKEKVADEKGAKKLKTANTSLDILSTKKTATSQNTSEIKEGVNEVLTTSNNTPPKSDLRQKSIYKEPSTIFNNRINNRSLTQKENAVANGGTTPNKKAVLSKNDALKNTSILEEGVALSTLLETKEEVEAIGNEKINSGFKKSIEINSPSLPAEGSDVLVAKEGASEEKKNEIDADKKSIFEAIDEQNKIKEEEVIAKKDPPKDRWEVAPNFAPVYYNSLSEGSSIDASFANNAQRGEVNFSYGVGVSYAVTNRLRIRSGVSTVDLSYSTGGIELGNGPVDVALRSVNYDRSQSVVIPQDKGSIAAQNSGGGFSDITLKSTNGEAFLNQNISYYEVPLELKYVLLNKKIGVNLIGGMSTLFLGNNEISVSAGDFNETLGAANNLSNVSFSTNVGIGFDYKLSRRFKFNVEPMFKYLLNPYTDASVDFRPYYLGVYTGLSFTF